MDIRRKITVLRALADDPRTPEAERRAAAAAVAAWEARLAEDQPAPPAPTPAEARSRALPPGPIDQVVLVLDRDTRTKGHVLSVVEVTARGEKHVLGRWSITMRIEWAEDAGEYLGFFGEGNRSAAAGERVAAMKIDVPESSVLRRLFDASQVMSLFVETGEQGVVYFGRAFIDSYEDRGWNDSRVSIVTLDEATQVGDLAPERPALPGARRVLAENGSRPKLTPPRLAPMREPGEDDDE